MSDEQLNQDEVESLLNQSGEEGPSKPDDAPDLPESGVLDPDEIEALLKSGKAAEASASEPAPTRSNRGDGERISAGDVEYLLQQAEQAIASIDEPADVTPEGMKPFTFQDFSGSPPSTEGATLELIRDVELDLKIELGRTHMQLEDVLALAKGSVVALDKLAGDPVDIFVNGRLIARGEVLVLNDNFCVRVAELVAGESSAAG